MRAIALPMVRGLRGFYQLKYEIPFSSLVFRHEFQGVQKRAESELAWHERPRAEREDTCLSTTLSITPSRCRSVARSQTRRAETSTSTAKRPHATYASWSPSGKSGEAFHDDHSAHCAAIHAAKRSKTYQIDKVTLAPSIILVHDRPDDERYGARGHEDAARRYLVIWLCESCQHYKCLDTVLRRACHREASS